MISARCSPVWDCLQTQGPTSPLGWRQECAREYPVGFYVNALSLQKSENFLASSLFLTWELNEHETLTEELP